MQRWDDGVGRSEMNLAYSEEIEREEIARTHSHTELHATRERPQLGWNPGSSRAIIKARRDEQ